MDSHEGGRERSRLLQNLVRAVRNIGRASIDLDPAIVEALNSREGLKFAELPDPAPVIPLDIYRKRKPEIPKQYPNLIRVTFNGQAELMDEVMRASQKRGGSVTTFIHEALSTELFISEKREQGKKILYEESPGDLREIVWTKDPE